MAIETVIDYEALKTNQAKLMYNIIEQEELLKESKQYHENLRTKWTGGAADTFSAVFNSRVNTMIKVLDGMKAQLQSYKEAGDVLVQADKYLEQKHNQGV